MLKNILFLIITTLIFTACTPQETDDSKSVDFINKTRYRAYDHPNNSLVNVHTLYNAKIYKNGILINDTTYVNNAFFYKETENIYWKFIKSFGKDSLGVIYRSKDTALVRYKVLKNYRFVFANIDTSMVDTNSSNLPNINYQNLDSISARRDILKMDSINASRNYYLTYPKWKEAIMRKYF